MRVLITGGAGFIGSNVVEQLLKQDQVSKIVIVDNFSTGSRKNIEEFIDNPKIEVIEEDIRDYKSCLSFCKNIDIISHQAAITSIPRSIEIPLTVANVNINGTLNIFNAGVKCGVKRIIYASSSSVYGRDSDFENEEKNPKSPYAVTKLVSELYANVFSKIYNINLIGLRYFNVFGNKQRNKGKHIGVIPSFINCFENRKPVSIYGDGLQTRDFTHIYNVVQANIKAMFIPNGIALNKVYDVGCGKPLSILELYHKIEKYYTESTINFLEPKKGEIKHSIANISDGEEFLNYNPTIGIDKGIELLINKKEIFI